jgi:hypothetical protein
LKTSIFSPFSKKAKAQKIAEITQKIDSAKSSLELLLRRFEIEQEKLHDKYEEKKETVINEVHELEKEVETLEIDNSMEDRKVACETLASAAKDLLQRNQS